MLSRDLPQVANSKHWRKKSVLKPAPFEGLSTTPYTAVPGSVYLHAGLMLENKQYMLFISKCEQGSLFF